MAVEPVKLLFPLRTSLRHSVGEALAFLRVPLAVLGDPRAQHAEVNPSPEIQ